MQSHRMRPLTFDKHQVVVRAQIQPPAVDAVPGRVGVARNRGGGSSLRFLGQQLGERGGGEVFVARSRVLREQFRAVALDQAGV